MTAPESKDLTAFMRREEAPRAKLRRRRTPSPRSVPLAEVKLARYFERHALAGARHAFDVAAERAGGPIPAEQCHVIGDTPHDIACGQAIDARTIAVATGGYSAAELAALGAWIVWLELPDPETFEAAVGLATPAASR